MKTKNQNGIITPEHLNQEFYFKGFTEWIIIIEHHRTSSICLEKSASAAKHELAIYDH